MKKDKFAELKEAHKNGAKIEFMNFDGTWLPCENNYPLWFYEIEYRIKPDCEYAKIERLKEQIFEQVEKQIKGSIANAIAAITEKPAEVSIVPDIEEANVTATAYKFLKLAKLLWLRDETWRRDGNWKPDWTDVNQEKVCAFFSKEKLQWLSLTTMRHFLAFSNNNIHDQFIQKHKSLIEDCKEFL